MGLPYRIRYLAALDSRFIDNVIEPPEAERAERAEWFSRLEESIRRDGVRNPVVLSARRLPEELSLVPRYGGSRVWAAQRHTLPVPAVIADFDDCFPEAPEVVPPEVQALMDGWSEAAIQRVYAGAIRSLFPDPPKKVIFKVYGLNISGCSDVHMGNLS